ncbi:hypothetical protein RDABS01_022862 [Bienertia sinuspersici]
MAAALIMLVAAALIFCYTPGVSSTSTFTADNPIKLASDFEVEFSSSFPNILHDEHHDASFSPRNKAIKAIYQFGDSLSDTGNLIREDPGSDYVNLPYGQTFFHKSTGRASNGLLVIDFFSMYFKLPFLDPYLKKDGNFSHGVNFAVAGASALNATTLAKKGIQLKSTNSSLLVQLDWFKSHLNSICSTKSECKEKLASSLVVMGEIGGNDYNWALLQGKKLSTGYGMVPEIVQLIKNAIKEVINLGAMHIVVPGNYPIGCFSVYLAKFNTNNIKLYDELKCLKYLNEFALFHNHKLQEVIVEVQKDHPNVAIVYADYYSALKQVLRHATSFG